ncbi:MAG: hypothetical protein ACRDJE_12220 [Dehalococcoidia bacterium]
MQDPLASLIDTCLSKDRLSAYSWHGSQDLIERLARYTWNIQLSESLYPALNYLEVALRNSIHAVASSHFADGLWYVSGACQFDENAVEIIEEAKQRLVIAKKPIEAGRLVAELHFGFWTSLFNGRYEHILWRPALHAAFPHKPSGITRKKLSSRLNKIRELRNRVFHYEPIWHWTDLAERHGQILEVLDWIDPTARRAVEMVDRFPVVFEAGIVDQERLWGNLAIYVGDGE